jgi:hypothetical protein
MTPIERIAVARATTATIDDALWPAIERLQKVGQVGNGAGIYADVAAFKEALRKTAATIAAAQKLIEATQWPSDEDYDAS